MLFAISAYSLQAVGGARVAQGMLHGALPHEPRAWVCLSDPKCQWGRRHCKLGVQRQATVSAYRTYTRHVWGTVP